eukprot:1795239-Pyramimonas_sp.AAC.2
MEVESHPDEQGRPRSAGRSLCLNASLCPIFATARSDDERMVGYARAIADMDGTKVATELLKFSDKGSPEVGLEWTRHRQDGTALLPMLSLYVRFQRYFAVCANGNLFGLRRTVDAHGGEYT